MLCRSFTHFVSLLNARLLLLWCCFFSLVRLLLLVLVKSVIEWAASGEKHDNLDECVKNANQSKGWTSALISFWFCVNTMKITTTAADKCRCCCSLRYISVDYFVFLEVISSSSSPYHLSMGAAKYTCEQTDVTAATIGAAAAFLLSHSFLLIEML